MHAPVPVDDDAVGERAADVYADQKLTRAVCRKRHIEIAFHESARLAGTRRSPLPPGENLGVRALRITSSGEAW
jgi:hypothetical protein